ncbi:uncharacterized protein LOC122386064 [Amphibalanus amphitrite]|uniref:uncharacterized protein LOC122386064 n=1 Tax=Amphibalanus amphitrite TaxID=1232801 RepID=UPI001C906974|nr:uncharacterized protein LOC122386064 [Amphibalanus amphitrite]
MSESHGVPEIPSGLLSGLVEVSFEDRMLGRSPDDGSETSAFVRIWRSVLEEDKSAGLVPFPGPFTVLAASEDGMRLVVPCDLPNPFRGDPEFQRAFVRRHVLTETVELTDGRFSSGGQARRLDGGYINLSMDEGRPAFVLDDRPPQVASPVPEQDPKATVYTIDIPLMTFDEIMEGIRRLKPRPWFCGRRPGLDEGDEPSAPDPEENQ